MKTLIPAILNLLTSPCGADEGAIESAKTHISWVIKGNHKELATSYAPEVMLMPGHEFLKAEYGLVKEGGRATGAQVASDKLIAAMEKAAADRPAPPAERTDALLDSLTYEVIEAAASDAGLAPSDPVGTPDGNLHFQVEAGDVLLKAALPLGDFILLQMRQIDGTWRVLGEYLD